jgi:hypothetical protein
MEWLRSQYWIVGHRLTVPSELNIKTAQVATTIDTDTKLDWLSFGLGLEHCLKGTASKFMRRHERGNIRIFGDYEIVAVASAVTQSRDLALGKMLQEQVSRLEVWP